MFGCFAALCDTGANAGADVEAQNLWSFPPRLFEEHSVREIPEEHASSRTACTTHSTHWGHAT